MAVLKQLIIFNEFYFLLTIILFCYCFYKVLIILNTLHVFLFSSSCNKDIGHFLVNSQTRTRGSPFLLQIFFRSNPEISSPFTRFLSSIYTAFLNPFPVQKLAVFSSVLHISPSLSVFGSWSIFGLTVSRIRACL